jgi:hypothetical protein
MAIKRFTATADTTITNALLEDLTTRASGANMGLADSLEVFSVYGQSSGSTNGLTSELSRVLVKFPVTTADDSTNSIQAKRSAGSIPASGSVSFYLRMYNVAHHETLPVNAKYNIFAVSSSWEEGRGIDLDTYTDKTLDGVGANWINANGSATAATATVTIANDGWVEAGATVSMIATDGTTVVATAHASTTTSEASTTAVQFARNGGSNAAVATALATAINYSSYFSATAALAVVTITQATAGGAGNTVITITEDGGVGFNNTNFTGGDGSWKTPGGDYHTGSLDADDNSAIMHSQTLSDGNEDIEVDISELVEQWIAGSRNNYGIGIYLTSSQEAYFKSSTGANLSAASGGVLHNLSGDTTSYYTKKFSARGSEYFFKRPCIEARWDSSTKDERGTFNYSSSLATADENMNKIYFYNYFKGKLRNIPGVGTDPIYVSFFSGSAADSAPFGSALELVVDAAAVTDSTRNTVVTGAYVSTGIYSASVCLTSAATPLKTIYDVWFKGGSGEAAPSETQYHTGTIKPEKLYGSAIAPDTRHVTNVTNMRKVYRHDETARLRVYTRLKNWNPAIYTKAVSTPKVDVVESGSYEIYRVVDDLKVIPYGTGSTTLHTQMSFDASGSYFDLDMSMLEAGYMYGVRLAYYNDSVGAWVDQPETFKFRVEK